MGEKEVEIRKLAEEREKLVEKRDAYKVELDELKT